jgi:hypothetical protein
MGAAGAADPCAVAGTVSNIFRKFQRDGVWEVIWAEFACGRR